MLTDYQMLNYMTIILLPKENRSNSGRKPEPRKMEKKGGISGLNYKSVKLG